MATHRGARKAVVQWAWAAADSITEDGGGRGGVGWAGGGAGTHDLGTAVQAGEEEEASAASEQAVGGSGWLH